MSFVVKAVSSVVKVVTKVVSKVFSVVTSVVGSLFSFIASPFMGSTDAANSASTEAQKQSGVLITNIGGGDNPIPIVYGLRQIGGTVIFVETGSNNNKYLWVCYALSEGQIEGLYSLEIETEDVGTPRFISALNTGAAVALDKVGSRYTGKCWFQLWVGQRTYDPSTLPGVHVDHLLCDAPSWKKKTSAMNGLACLFARYEFVNATTQAEADNNPFNGSIPAIRATILGRRVASLLPSAYPAAYDWGAFADGYTERYSTNPAEILFDYLRCPLYGKGLSNSEIDIPSFQRAAAKFNQVVAYNNGTSGPILTCNAVIDTGQTLMNNTKALLAGCRTYMPYVRGKYTLVVEDAGNPTDILSGSATIAAVFSRDDLLGDITYTGVDRTSQYSSVEVTYVSPADKWSNQTAIYPISESERIAAVTENGGRENKGTFTFGSITNYAMAFDMARLIFNKSRWQQTISFKTTARAAELEPGDNIQIAGAALNFPTGSGNNVPWRIITITANNDMSFDLQCVRNPDWIYPHVRANEKDVVIPPYLPMGNYIYYPGVQTDIGTRPPETSFVLATQEYKDIIDFGQTVSFPNTKALTIPPPTNPADPVLGGGVGDPSYSTGVVAPPLLSPPPPLVDFITIDKIDYVVTNGMTSATVSYKQPAHPNFIGVDFWFKRSISTDTTYKQDTDNQHKNAGDVLTHTFSNLIQSNVPYILYSRVKYTNGDSSSIASRTTLNVSGAVTTDNPTDYTETAGTGWTLPSTTTANYPSDTFISTLTATNSIGVGNVRILTMNITQDINSSYNPNVDGLTIYYRLKGTTYFNVCKHKFNSDYICGKPYTFVPNLDIGIGNPVPDTDADNFDFIFRFSYNNGTESTRQWRYVGVDVAQSTPVDVLSYYLRINEASTAFSFLTVDQAPVGTVTSPLDMTISIKSVSNSVSSNAIYFGQIVPPALADQPNWYGIRLRYREIPLAGGNVPYITVDNVPVSSDVTGYYVKQPINYDTTYEYILTPLVRSGGQMVEAKKSWKLSGAIHNRTSAPDYPVDSNWYSRLYPTQIDSTIIPALEAAPISSSTTPRIVSWKKVITKVGSQAPDSAYLELVYNVSHLTNVDKVRVYRRANESKTGQATIGDGTTSAKYYGLGRWEFIDITGTNSSTLANGDIVVNLRAPTDRTEFNGYYGINAGVTLENTTGSWGITPVGSVKVLATTANGYDYVLVVYQNGNPSAKGMLLPWIGSSTTTLTTASLPQEVVLTTLDGYATGYKRNFTVGTDGCRLSTLDTNLRLSTMASSTYTPPTPTRGAAVI